MVIHSQHLKDLREWLAGEIQFTGYFAGWSQSLFSCLWDSVLFLLLNQYGDVELSDYCRLFVLSRNDSKGLWDAEWRTCTNLTMWGCGDGHRLSRAGLTSGTLSQAIESSFHTLKGMLPSNYHHMDMAASTQLLLSSVEALWVTRQWAREGEVRLTNVDVRVNGIHMRFVTGDAAWSDRLICIGDSQLRLPSVVSLMVSAPENFEITEIPRLELDDVVRVYTLPYQTSNMKIDKLTHECLVQLMYARRGIRDIRLLSVVGVGPCVRYVFKSYVPAR